jgi:hypothetical protein
MMTAKCVTTSLRRWLETVVRTEFPQCLECDQSQSILGVFCNSYDSLDGGTIDLCRCPERKEVPYEAQGMNLLVFMF